MKRRSREGRERTGYGERCKEKEIEGKGPKKEEKREGMEKMEALREESSNEVPQSQ